MAVAEQVENGNMAPFPLVGGEGGLYNTLGCLVDHLLTCSQHAKFGRSYRLAWFVRLAGKGQHRPPTTIYAAVHSILQGSNCPVVLAASYVHNNWYQSRFAQLRHAGSSAGISVQRLR